MRVSEVRLRQIVLEEAHMRLVEYYIEEALEDLGVEKDDPDYEEYKRMSRRSFLKNLGKAGAGLAAVGLAAKLSGAGELFQQKSDETHQGAEAVRQAFRQSAEKRKMTNSFLTDANAPPIMSQAQVDKIVDDIILRFGNEIEPTREVGPGRGLPQEPFFVIPPEQIPDDYVMPFVGMKKTDYEKFIDGWDTRHLKDMAKGGKPGSSVYWGYGYESDSPVFSFIAPDAPKGQRGMLMPPEYGVVLDLYKQRTQADPDPK
jgi:hypothetical protein